VEVAANVCLTDCNLEVKLLYDFDHMHEEKQEVNFVKNAPLDAKINLNDTGDRAKIEVKIKVLTSQHEDSLFRVRILATDPMTKLPFDLFTHPIKVISKMNQMKKKDPTSSPTSVPSKKRDRSTLTSSISGNGIDLATSVKNLEEVQRKQAETLDLIWMKLNDSTLPLQTLSLASQHPSLALSSDQLEITEKKHGNSYLGNVI